MRDRGFTLVEVLASLALLSAAALALGHVLAQTIAAFHAARLQTMTAALAASRLEELSALAWAIDGAGNPVSDRETNLSTVRPSSGGPGLSISPTSSLLENAAGYVDFLDEHGGWVSAGPAVPSSAVFVRRWSVQPAASAAPDTLLLEVLVRPVAYDGGADRRPAVARSETHLVTLKTRVGP